jgi:hypothetical protein
MVLFDLGRIVATPGALQALAQASDDVRGYLFRHMLGDWGLVDEHDQRENDFSVQHGLRVVSHYKLSDGTDIWIITEADRSVTTVLLPGEY